MPKQTFLESPEDMAWIAELYEPTASSYACAILYGNEDWPDKIELYATNHHKCRPTIVMMSDSGQAYVHTFGKIPTTRK